MAGCASEGSRQSKVQHHQVRATGNVDQAQRDGWDGVREGFSEMNFEQRPE